MLAGSCGCEVGGSSKHTYVQFAMSLHRLLLLTSFLAQHTVLKSSWLVYWQALPSN